MPCRQVRSQEELHCSMTRRPETSYLGGGAKVEDIWPSISYIVLRGSPRVSLRTNIWSPKKRAAKNLREKAIGIFIWNFSMSWIFRELLLGSRKNYRNEKSSKRLRCIQEKRMDTILRLDCKILAGVGFKTEPTTPHQIGGVRLSETKGAHKS